MGRVQFHPPSASWFSSTTPAPRCRCFKKSVRQEEEALSTLVTARPSPLPPLPHGNLSEWPRSACEATVVCVGATDVHWSPQFSCVCVRYWRILKADVM